MTEQTKVVAICIPNYSGRICWQTALRLRQEEAALAMAGWRISGDTPIYAAGCSAIHIVRNDLVAQARQRGCDALVFVDDDMDWEPAAITRLLSHDVDVIGAAVPLKVTPITWNIGWLDKDVHKVREDERGLIEVSHVGTGLMAIKMSVFDRLEAHLGREYQYIHKQDGRECTAFFEAPIAWGEDSRFCWHWRQAGGKVFVDPAITMTHIIAPNWEVKANLSSWLGEIDPMARAVAGLKDKASPEHFTALYEAWGNQIWSATPDMLSACYDMARQATGPIVECGSGISTFVMALANPNAEIHSLEHDEEWAQKLKALLARFNLDHNVRLYMAPLIEHAGGRFYDVAGLPAVKFALAVMDGPPNALSNRNVAYGALGARIDAAVLIVDDVNNPGVAAGLEKHTEGRAGETGVYANTIKRWAIFVPEARSEAA